MSYNGFEIDMLNLGDADSLLVTHWVDGVATRILIDGGYAKDYETLSGFLFGLNIQTLNHVVCSHPHSDHAEGLVKLLKDTRFNVQRLWAHRPRSHIDRYLLQRAMYESGERKVMKVLQESLKTQDTLISTATQRGIPCDIEPFTGQQVGPLTVCGPTKEFYESLLLEFTNVDELAEFETLMEAQGREDAIADFLESAGIPDPDAGLLDAPQTEPENESCTILGTQHKDTDGTAKILLFTADAGTVALEQAKTAYPVLKGCHWMQIPHHGSRHNITLKQIQEFAPKTAFVSAAGNKKHPRPAVVNAFKDTGTKVFSTHYPASGGHKRFPVGVVPDRPGYVNATPLYEAKS